MPLPYPPKPAGVSDEVHRVANEPQAAAAASVAELVSANYANPTLSCDVVLKGGVTSGIVYPTALCRLAQDFRFKRIGGTSVGALAAAAAAAAEVGRTLPGAGFGAFATLSTELSEGDNLLNLFVPAKSLRPLFDVLLSAVQPRPLWQLLGIVLAAAARHFWACTLVAAVVTIAGTTLVYLGNGWFPALETALLGAVFLVIALAVRVYGYVTGRLPHFGFGLCSGSRAGTGMSASPPGGSEPSPERAPLIEFLADRLNLYAGRGLVSQGTPAITFGDLWGDRQPPKDMAAVPHGVVDLAMMTTNLTLGRPHRIPFDPEDEFAFYFDVDEFEEIFPKRIVAQMKAASQPAPATVLAKLHEQNIDRGDLRTFPDRADLPLIVAARMSMSYPVLFRTIPVYVEDKVPTEFGDTFVRRCLLSDGGLTSNMPLHFFDGPYPRWPTFAIDLRGIPKERQTVPNPKPEEFAFMAGQRSQDFTDIRLGASGIVSLVTAFIGTMQNWNDSVMMRVPGYVERTVQIALSSTEGGVNLNMSTDTRKMLAQRGLLAGEILDGRFIPDGQRNSRWLAHRATRASSFLSMAERLGIDSIVESKFDFSPGPQQQAVIGGLADPAAAYAEALGSAFGSASSETPITKNARSPHPELHTRPRL
jgi:predicted acylesterase/phospholipase RssA